MSAVNATSLAAVLALALTHASQAGQSCSQALGAAKAHRLVEQCIQVSPATHPPCNAANACSLIENEVRRGCDLLGKDAPAFCASYRHPS